MERSFFNTFEGMDDPRNEKGKIYPLMACMTAFAVMTFRPELFPTRRLALQSLLIIRGVPFAVDMYCLIKDRSVLGIQQFLCFGRYCLQQHITR